MAEKEKWKKEQAEIKRREAIAAAEAAEEFERQAQAYEDSLMEGKNLERPESGSDSQVSHFSCFFSTISNQPRADMSVSFIRKMAAVAGETNATRIMRIRAFPAPFSYPTCMKDQDFNRWPTRMTLTH